MASGLSIHRCAVHIACSEALSVYSISCYLVNTTPLSSEGVAETATARVCGRKLLTYARAGRRGARLVRMPTAKLRSSPAAPPSSTGRAVNP